MSQTRRDVVVRRKTPLAWLDELVEDVLQRMSEHSVSVVPDLERDTERFLGAVSTSDITQLITMETMGESRSPHARIETVKRSRPNQQQYGVTREDS